MTLSYAFMLSFSGLFDSHISSTMWPLIWLAIFCVTMIDPTRFMHRPSRYWILKNWTWLFLPGLTSVEFADFWMGDQLCSMAYSLSHLYYVGCVYGTGWRDANTSCNLARNWISGILLASLPSIIRFIQCIKRYADSENRMHLVNGGKYLSSVLAYCVFFNWRSHGMKHDLHFVVWIIFSALSSLYTSGWDILKDWSLFETNAEHPFLRHELLYADYYPVYYAAMIANVSIRFVWIIYSPESSVDYPLRNFIAGALEMLRRVLWNFFRVENEHIGHADQYRVTRDIPLPYSFDHGDDQDDSDDDGPPSRKSTSSWLGRQRDRTEVEEQANPDPSYSEESFSRPPPGNGNVRLRTIHSESP